MPHVLAPTWNPGKVDTEVEGRKVLERLGRGGGRRDEERFSIGTELQSEGSKDFWWGIAQVGTLDNSMYCAFQKARCLHHKEVTDVWGDRWVQHGLSIGQCTHSCERHKSSHRAEAGI